MIEPDKLSKDDAAELDNLEREAKEFDKDAEIDRTSAPNPPAAPKPTQNEPHMLTRRQAY